LKIVTADRFWILGVSVTADALQIDAGRGRRAAAEFTTHVAGEGECHLVQSFFRPVVILDLDAVVGVDASPVRYVEIVVAESVIIGDNVHPGSGSPFDLPA